MSDMPKAVAGLVIFVALVTFPIWYMLASAEGPSPPERSADKDGPRCIEDNMAAHHMEMLDQWRYDVVHGDGTPQYHDEDKRYEKSLTKTCMGCHGKEEDRNSAPSCSGCHEYASVRPTCWDCHIDPKEEPSNGE